MVKYELWLGNALLWRAYSMDGTAPTPSFAIPEGAVWKHETVPVPPKPATPEPFDPMKTIYPSDFFTHPPDPVTDFIARRVAKRKAVSPDDHPWARAGHAHATWSTDVCPKCLLTGREVVERGYYPTCDDYKRERETAGNISRAMSQPGPHDTPMHTRLIPYRGMNQ